MNCVLICPHFSVLRVKILILHCSASLGRGKGLTQIFPCISFILFLVSVMFSIQGVDSWILLLHRTSFLHYLKLTLAYLIRLLWSRSSYPRNCYDWVFTIIIGSLSFWRNFLLLVWQRLFRHLPLFFWQVCWSFWRSVTGCGRLVLNNTLPKILPFSSGSTAVAFYILHTSQINGCCLVLRNIRLSLGEKLMKFQRNELEMFCLSPPLKFWRCSVYQYHLRFLQQQRQGFSTDNDIINVCTSFS